jgi:hypothetical protein
VAAAGIVAEYVKTAALCHIRDRRVTRLVIYCDHEHALAD